MSRLRTARHLSRTYGFQLAVLALAALTGATKVVERVRARHERVPFSPFFSAFGVLGTLRTMAYSARGSRVSRNLVLVALALALATQRAAAAYLPHSALVQRRRPFLLSFLGGLWYFSYRLHVAEAPKVGYAGTPFASSLVELLRARLREFKPVFWAFDGNAQTVLLNSVNSTHSLLFHRLVRFQREAVEAFDGNMVFLDWAQTEDEDHTLGPASPVLFILHGIMGSADEGYCRNLVARAGRAGYRACVQFRWRLDFGEWRDVDVALRHIQARYPRAPMVAVGFSAGAHVLMCYLQHVGTDTPLTAAVATSPAFDLTRILDYADGKARGAYGRALRYALLRCIDRHLEADTKLGAEARAAVARDVAELSGNRLYDRWLTRLPDYSGRDEDAAGTAAPMPSHDRFGNGTSGHYVRTAVLNMHKIAIPTLVMLAHDDPILPPPLVAEALAAAKENPSIITLTTQRGGHVGWHQGVFPFGHSWIDDATVGFIGAVLQLHAQTRFILDVSERGATDASATLRRICSTPRVSAAALPGSGSPAAGSLKLRRSESGHQRESLL